jgi:hypothetical protein
VYGTVATGPGHRGTRSLRERDPGGVVNCCSAPVAGWGVTSTHPADLQAIGVKGGNPKKQAEGIQK